MVEYDTTNASVAMEGASSAESNLKVGMVVKLVGSVDANGTTGVASSIGFSDEAEGLVTGVFVPDAAGSTTGALKVMGQTVYITKDTLLDSDISGTPAPTAAGLVIGDWVEVSGYSAADGKIYATRIALKTAGTEVELKGVVSLLDSVAKHFMLGALLVNYDTSTTGSALTGLADGLYVEVKFPVAGALTGLQLATPTLLASKIDIEDDGKKGEQGAESEEGEVQGKITSALAGSVFTLNGQSITVDINTKYEDGKTNSTADIVVGLKAEVEGKYNANGDLVATKVHFGHDEASIMEKSGTFTSYDAASHNLVFAPTGGGPAITTIVNNMTIVKDDSAAADRYFNASKLVAGNTIEIKYDAATFIVTRLERK
ncbi:MAG: DUF5666 domain-containing protein [Gammaproteobacteria bacterium]|nr:DUF5666 domain-containing protein [Gammaproteobacteria bacterium]